MGLSRFLQLSLLPVMALVSNVAHAEVSEPQKLASPAKLKPGEGAVRLSVRTQRQFTETFFLYFVRLDEAGSDTDSFIRIERGAGVPLAGSNMIDPKPVTYRFPTGRYRLLGYTMRCQGVPFEGALCFGSLLSDPYPTGYYKTPSPTLEVKEGGYTEAGDFILEYTGPRPTAEIDGILEVDALRADIRWRPLLAARPTQFANLPTTGSPTIPAGFESRITCDVRPKGVTLYIPFTC